MSLKDTALRFDRKRSRRTCRWRVFGSERPGFRRKLSVFKPKLTIFESKLAIFEPKLASFDRTFASFGEP